VIQAIYVAKKSKQPQMQIDVVKVDAGKGIVGDRYYGKKGHDGPNITFVESEEIAAFNMNRSEERRVGKECRSRW